MSSRTQRQQGFTLIELMIVVAIIGILAATAIPSFRNYQFKAKRGEAYANLAALAKTQKAFFAEYGQYVGVPLPEPGFTQSSLPGTAKRGSAEVEAAFSDVGWTPVGDIYYDYGAVTGAAFNAGGSTPACACPACLTLAAYGDLDGDVNLAVILYVQPDELGATCSEMLGNTAPVTVNGDPQYNEVVQVGASSTY